MIEDGHSLMVVLSPTDGHLEGVNEYYWREDALSTNGNGKKAVKKFNFLVG